MLCDSCHQKEAVIHMTQVVNGRRSERHLCRDCARKENLINDPFDLWNQEVFAHPFDSFFGNDFVNPFQHAEQNLQPGLSCSNCGKTYQDFRKDSLLGCEECYNQFRSKLKNFLNKNQGTDQHIGKAPGKQDEEKTEGMSEINRLKSELKKCIKEENYEQAAVIRDQINKLEGGSSK